MTTTKFFSKIDYAALAFQKLTLLRLLDDVSTPQNQADDLVAIVHLIDAIQDTAVSAGVADESTVFTI